MSKATHSIYKPHWTTDPEPDKSRCRESIHARDRTSTFYQCRSKPTVFEDVHLNGKSVRMGFCKIHCLEAQQARLDKSDARIDREIALGNLKTRQARLLDQIGLAAVAYVEAPQESTMEQIQLLTEEYKEVKARRKKLLHED